MLRELSFHTLIVLLLSTVTEGYLSIRDTCIEHVTFSSPFFDQLESSALYFKKILMKLV